MSHWLAHAATMAATTPADDRPDFCPAAADSAPDELVASAFSPVKAALLRPPPVRDSPANEVSRASGVVPLEMKTKRQFRRERNQGSTDDIRFYGDCWCIFHPWSLLTGNKKSTSQNLSGLFTSRQLDVFLLFV